MPASTAAAPIPSSQPFWNPAVPPPPVAGGAMGNGLGDAVGDGVGDGVGETVGVGVGVTVGVGVWAGLALSLGVSVPGPGVAEALRVGGLGSEADGEPEQAARPAQAIKATTPKPAVISLA